MKFSILIPVYNVEKYIDECLKAVINQTYKDFEVIITDDGSTDTSGAICDKYEKEYPFIKVIHQKNTGLLGARRTGLAAAQGEYIIFLDSDDFVSNGLLESLANVLEKREYDIILYNAYKYIDGKTRLHKAPLFDKDKEFIGNTDELINSLLLRRLSNTLCTKAVKRTIIDIERDYKPYYHVTLGEDLLQLLPIISKAQSIYYLNKKLYYYRTNMSSLTQNYKSSNYNSLRTVNMVLDEYCAKWGKNEYTRYAGYRYLVDVYDVLCQIARTPCGFDKKKEVKNITNDVYFQQKYKEAESELLSNQQRIMLRLAEKQNYLLLYPYMWIYKMYIYIKNRR